ncbi:ring finger protein 212B [Phyllostomus discolor]|uniref:Ring finger protein 212B n=1 Tax=Phyllostomus discolor TaxID=89673 RepID=A0A834BMY8_9CHIR|nr:ring finger protein 212B [Phyllostomus discolor]
MTYMLKIFDPSSFALALSIPEFLLQFMDYLIGSFLCFLETPSPASTHSLSYRTSSASSGLGIFSFRPSLNGGDLGHTQVLTPNNSGQRESRAPLQSLPGFQLPDLQVSPG